jgi:hypothetical protein
MKKQQREDCYDTIDPDCIEKQNEGRNMNGNTHKDIVENTII